MAAPVVEQSALMRRGGRRLILAFLMLLLLLPAHARQPDCIELFDAEDPALYQFVRTRASVDFSSYEGALIGEITVLVLPIFNPDDPQENNWLYRSANFLHIDTRRGTVRRQLTVQAGERLQATKLEESERILRQKNYFSDAMIVPARLCGERLDLLVVVRDVWALTPLADFSRAGGESTSGAGFSYDNVFGTGQQLAVFWATDDERTSTTVVWQANDLFGEHVRLSGAYADRSDGNLRQLSVVRPFYELDSRWTAGASWRRETFNEEIKLLDTLLNRYQRNVAYDEAFVGWSAGLRDGRVRRWRLGIADQQDRYGETNAPSEPPADQRLVYPWLSVESLSDQFWRATNISFSARQEDIALGFRWSALAGLAQPSFGSTEKALPFMLRTEYAVRGGQHHLTQLSAQLRGRWQREAQDWASTFAATEARYYYFISRRDRWFSRVRLDAATGIDPDQQLTSGGSDALRGYPLNTQRGDRRWLASVERRHFTDWHPFNLVHVGGAMYLDAGRTWDSHGQLMQLDDTLVNAGVGLRLNSSKFRVDRVLHLDYAVPLVARDVVASHQIILSGKVEF
jgi:outer membrane protein assembly factor BamA